jgi:NAD-dependent dihydropyrimidine dehydrogenase PreA subunit
MNPDRHATSHYDYFKDLIKGDDASAEAHRKFYDEYNAVLDMDADYYLETIKTWCSRNSSWSMAPGKCATPKARASACVPQDITTTACSPSKANWTTSRARAKPKPPTACAPACPLSNQKAPGSQGCRALRHLQRPPLARRGLPAGQGLHPGPPGKAQSRCSPRGTCGSCKSRTQKDSESPFHQAVTAAAVERIHAALPQTQCTRCGYPDCHAYAQAIALEGVAINRCPPGGAEGIERLAQLTGRPAEHLDPDHGVEGPRTVAFIDENWCIGCTLCLDACPTDAIVGSHKRNAHRAGALVHRLRAVHPGVPGGLYRAGARDRRSHRMGRLVASASPTCASERYALRGTARRES